MYSKIFRVIWIISFLAVLVVFFYAYAALQDTVHLGLGTLAVSRSGFFYFLLSLLALTNASGVASGKLLSDDFLKSWFYGLLASMHLFLIAALVFLAILNSNEQYDYSRLGPFVILAFGLFAGWMLALPVLGFFRRSKVRS